MAEAVRAASLDADVHLLIHAHVSDPVDTSFVASALRSLRALVPGRAAHASRTRTQVRVEDLQGHPLCAWDDAGDLLDVPLRAGVYRVTVSHGTQKLRYTVSLNAGHAVNLHVQLPQKSGSWI